MLHRAITAQNQTVERLKSLFHGEPIPFTLVGSAACREYGLSRDAKDLDFVVNGHAQAMIILTRSGEYKPVLDSPDP